MSKAVWPGDKWVGSETGKVSRSDDGRVVLSLSLRYAMPETWNTVLFVYGPEGCSDERQGWFELMTVGSFEEAVARIKKIALAADLITSQTVN